MEGDEIDVVADDSKDNLSEMNEEVDDDIGRTTGRTTAKLRRSLRKKKTTGTQHEEYESDEKSHRTAGKGDRSYDRLTGVLKE